MEGKEKIVRIAEDGKERTKIMREFRRKFTNVSISSVFHNTWPTRTDFMKGIETSQNYANALAKKIYRNRNAESVALKIFYAPKIENRHLTV